MHSINLVLISNGKTKKNQIKTDNFNEFIILSMHTLYIGV
jgi:hypothetical protein